MKKLTLLITLISLTLMGYAQTNKDIGGNTFGSQSQLYKHSDDTLSVILRTTGKHIIYRPSSLMEIKNDTFFYENVKLTNADYAGFLQELCPIAYQEYRKGIFPDITSRVTLWLELGELGYTLYELVRVAVWMFKDIESPELERHGRNAAISFGTGLLTTAIRNYAESKKIKHYAESVYIFNHECSLSPQKKRPAELSFNVSINSVGLSLNF